LKYFTVALLIAATASAQGETVKEKIVVQPKVQAQPKTFVGGWAAKSEFKPGYIKDVLVTNPA